MQMISVSYKRDELDGNSTGKPLFPKEKAIIYFLGNIPTLQNKSLGVLFGCTERTIKNQFVSIFRKIHIPNRGGVTAWYHLADNQRLINDGNNSYIVTGQIVWDKHQRIILAKIPNVLTQDVKTALADIESIWHNAGL
jgi:DNA-binding CsgD family transcriptional regulator